MGPAPAGSPGLASAGRRAGERKGEPIERAPGSGWVGRRGIPQLLSGAGRVGLIAPAIASHDEFVRRNAGQWGNDHRGAAYFVDASVRAAEAD
jgi:hypothetical protein